MLTYLLHFPQLPLVGDRQLQEPHDPLRPGATSGAFRLDDR